MFKFWRRQQKAAFKGLDTVYPLGIGIEFGSGKPVDKDGKEVHVISVSIVAKVADNIEWIRKRIMHEVKEGESVPMALAEVLEAVALECRRLHRARKEVVAEANPGPLHLVTLDDKENAE